MSLTLHKVSAGPCDGDVIAAAEHVFTFVWDDVARLAVTSSTVTSSSVTSSTVTSAVRSVESSEVKHAGHAWTVVVTRKVSP